MKGKRRTHYSLNLSLPGSPVTSQYKTFSAPEGRGGDHSPDWSGGELAIKRRRPSFSLNYRGYGERSYAAAPSAYGFSNMASNVKMLLIGDAGVGKTAMILSYCNELPTRSQLWKHSSHMATQGEGSEGSKRRLKTLDVRKRYSLNDYEELFSSSPTLGEKEDMDDDELVIETKSTIGVDIKTSMVDVDNRLFKVIMWDTAGQERYRNAMVPSLYKGTHGVILTYDICDLASFRSCLERWIPEALQHKPCMNARFYLVGNKIDRYKDRMVAHTDVQELMEVARRTYNVEISGHFEVSCKWSHVVERAFNLIVKDAIEHGCYDDNVNGQDTNNNEAYTSSDETIQGTSTHVTPNVGGRSRRSSISIRQELRQRGVKSTTIDVTKPKHDGALSETIQGSSCCS